MGCAPRRPSFPEDSCRTGAEDDPRKCLAVTSHRVASRFALRSEIPNRPLSARSSNPKTQIPSKSQIIKTQIDRTQRALLLEMGFEVYLGFGAWDLGFPAQRA